MLVNSHMFEGHGTLAGSPKRQVLLTLSSAGKRLSTRVPFQPLQVRSLRFYLRASRAPGREFQAQQLIRFLAEEAGNLWRCSSINIPNVCIS